MPQTGATRYQKFLKSEKSKTKLKAKKDLPKGTNITKTNFKVKKIVIKEQLKKHGDTEALSTRKLNVNELLLRLNHFNTNSRTDALQGLKDLITRNPEVLEQHLGQLINSVTPLILNIEKVVRRDTLQVLQTMLTNVRTEKIDPFYDIMSTYLRSAMTHIDNRIQEDSLLFLDVLLLLAPIKVVTDFHKIIPNFLDMISKLRIDSKPGRTLTVNLGSQITSVKWRVKVLHRLKDYLNKFVQHEKVHVSEHGAINTIKAFDALKFNHYPLFSSNYTSLCHLSCFSSKKAQDTTPVDEIVKFMEYIDTLMPLLFETWLEVCPNASGEKNFETVISEEAASLLNHTLQVISLLWTLIKHLNKKTPSSDIQNIFCQKYLKQYTQHFVKMFPFVTNIRSKQKNESTPFESVITDAKLVCENLKICHLYILLSPNINVKTNNKEIESVINYIEETFNQNSPDDVKNAVLKILNTIFSKEVNSWAKTSVDALFRKIIWAFFSEKSSAFKCQLFSLLCRIALNDSLGHLHQNLEFDLWLKKLPNILLEAAINLQTVDILHKFAVQSNDSFNAVIKPMLPKIIENLPVIKITDAVNDTSSYHKLFALLYWIKVWDNDALNQLEKQMLSAAYKPDHDKFIIDTLRIKASATSEKRKCNIVNLF